MKLLTLIVCLLAGPLLAQYHPIVNPYRFSSGCTSTTGIVTDSGSTFRTDTYWAGIRFTMASTKTVCQLGVMKRTGNTGIRRVMLFNYGGSLVASNAVDMASVSVGQYAKVQVTATLNSGSEYVMYVGESTGQNWDVLHSVTPGAAISQCGDAYWQCPGSDCVNNAPANGTPTGSSANNSSVNSAPNIFYQ